MHQHRVIGTCRHDYKLLWPSRSARDQDGKGMEACAIGRRQRRLSSKIRRKRAHKEGEIGRTLASTYSYNSCMLDEDAGTMNEGGWQHVAAAD